MPTITTGRYLKKEDVSEDGELHTIKELKEENVEQDNKPPRIKWVMYFADCKPMVLNATNIKRCMKVFGKETDAWVGKSVEVYADPDIEFAGETVGGLRLRVR